MGTLSQAPAEIDQRRMRQEKALEIAFIDAVTPWVPHRLLAQSLPGISFFASRLFRLFFRIAPARAL
jgi:hypothetical protein